MCSQADDPSQHAASATDEPDCHCGAECAACYNGHVCDSRRHKPCRTPRLAASATEEPRQRTYVDWSGKEQTHGD